MFPNSTSAFRTQLSFSDRPENGVRILQCFFASDIEPFPLDLVRLYWFTRVEPLHEPARLIGVIAGCKVRGQEREDRGRVIVNGDCGQGSARLLWFLFQVSNDSTVVD